MPVINLGKIPREMVMWHPLIDPNKCTGCGRCVDFCPNDVFEKPINGIAKVVNPNNCDVGCFSCMRVCAPRAIQFPPIDAVMRLIKELRKVYK